MQLYLPGNRVRSAVTVLVFSGSTTGEIAHKWDNPVPVLEKIKCSKTPVPPNANAIEYVRRHRRNNFQGFHTRRTNLFQ